MRLKSSGTRQGMPRCRCGTEWISTGPAPVVDGDGFAECSVCAAYRRGHADGLREAEQARAAEPMGERVTDGHDVQVIWTEIDALRSENVARRDTADALLYRISAVEWQLDALAAGLREWGEARAAREAERKELQR